MLKKFLSRKFIFTAIADLTGLMTMVIGNDAVTTIIGASFVLIATIVFCIVEGVIDAKSVGQITNAVEDIAESLGADDKIVDAIGEIGNVAENLVGGNGGEPSINESE